MIELLGVSVQDGRKAWLFRKACARFDRATLSVVVAGSPAARSHRMAAVVSLASIELARQHADQVLVLADGALKADRGAPELHAAWARGLESVVRC